MTDRELERLYDTHAGGLFHYLMGFTRSEADARDLLQEVFIKLARGASGEAFSSEKAWIYRLGHNLAVDWLRRRKVRWEAEEHLLAEAESTGPQFMPDLDAAVLAGHFATAMDTLPETQRVVLHLKLWEDMTFEEIAEAHGIPLNTAASRYRYALEKLRVILRPLYEELT